MPIYHAFGEDPEPPARPWNVFLVAAHRQQALAFLQRLFYNNERADLWDALDREKQLEEVPDFRDILYSDARIRRNGKIVDA